MPKKRQSNKVTKRRSNTRKRRFIPFLLISIGLLCLGLWASHAWAKYQALTLGKNDLVHVQEAKQSPPKPRHIFIRWFIDVDIEDTALVGNRWGVSEHNASYLTQSARPGEIGNIIVYGHNTQKIMGNIRALKGGEPIYVTTEDGVLHTYKVTELHEVEPVQVAYLQPTSEETLTLYTCSGFWDRKRFIVVAKKA